MANLYPRPHINEIRTASLRVPFRILKIKSPTIVTTDSTMYYNWLCGRDRDPSGFTGALDY